MGYGKSCACPWLGQIKPGLKDFPREMHPHLSSKISPTQAFSPASSYSEAVSASNVCPSWKHRPGRSFPATGAFLLFPSANSISLTTWQYLPAAQPSKPSPGLLSTLCYTVSFDDWGDGAFMSGSSLNNTLGHWVLSQVSRMWVPQHSISNKVYMKAGGLRVIHCTQTCAFVLNQNCTHLAQSQCLFRVSEQQLVFL